MAKHTSSIRDLVIQAMKNGSKIEADAKNNSAEACFQMGMIYLLGIDTPIDFKKAASYFETQSLSGDSNVNRLLGFIAECEGNYSEAFKHYAKISNTTNKGKETTLYKKISDERNNLQKFFKEMDLPSTALNKEITTLLNSYIKGGKSKIDACLQIATICDDETSCFEVAQVLYDTKDFYSAKKWLQKGNITSDNSLYIAINDKLTKPKKGFSLSNTPQIIDIQGRSLLPDNYVSYNNVEIRHRCDSVSLASKKLWLKEVSNLITQIKKNLKEEEEKRLEKQRKKEYQAFLREQAEEEERAKLHKNIITIVIVAICGFIWGLLAEGNIYGGFICTGILLFIYFMFKLIIKAMK